MRRCNLKQITRKTILSLFFLGICFGGYAGANGPETGSSAIQLLETVRQNYLAHQRLVSLQNSKTVNINKDVPANMWLKKVKSSEVNMVTNRYAGTPQDAVKIDGKTYYASGEVYALNIKDNPSVRFAKDPVTNNTIDKADAITYMDASGRVLYFESDMSFEQFVGLASSETLYGYSK